jgi:hypothetical protein
LVELVELGRGIQTEFVGQPVTELVVGLGGVGGAPVPGEGKHAQFDQALAGGVLAGQARQFREELLVAAKLDADGERFLFGAKV